MKKQYLILLCLLGTFTALVAQKVSFTPINKPNISLRGNPVVLGQVTVEAETAGKVILRFDGDCISTTGDRIVLAASSTTSWGENDGCVELECASADINSNPFSHTRSYEVQAGTHTYYAVAQNFYEMAGNGIASIFGTLTAEWFPELPGKAFALHKGFFYENVLVEGAPTAFNSITFDAPGPGKVLVRFDGKCISSYGDLMFFAASPTPTWSNYDGSTSTEVVSNDFNRFSFAHTRMFDVEAGTHTYYAVVENYFEIYGNGFASIYGSLTIEFFPANQGTQVLYQPISTQFGVQIDGPPATVGTINLHAPVAGKVAVNFAGTCVASNGDQVRLAASDHPDWTPNDGCVQYEPYSSDHNRTSFSHSRVYEVTPGDHQFYAVVQNFEEYEGSGLAVIYAGLTAKYFPEGTIAATEPQIAERFSLSPNPSNDVVRISYADLAGEAFILSLCDTKGTVLRTYRKLEQEYSEDMTWPVSDLPAGVYFIKITHATGTGAKSFVRL